LSARRQVVVTGAGVISPLADSPRGLHKALCAGTSGLKPIELFSLDGLGLDGHGPEEAGEIRPFEPRQYLGERNLRPVDRTSRLLLAAAQAALDESGWTPELRSEREVGLVLGTTFCSVKTIAEFDRRGIQLGPSHVSPLDFANSVINAAAGQTAIWHGLRGVNSTISAGEASGLLAIASGAGMISSGHTAALLAAFATYAAGFLVRPFGALFFGRLGDLVGRKYTFMVTIVVMGLSTVLVGCLPTYASIGVLAPILLVLLRLLQGLSASGEQAGANSMTLEHAPDRRRGFFTSFTLEGTQAGLILANLAFLAVAALPDEQLFSWGWRIPFFLSALVVAVGYWVRRSLPETPEFQKAEQAHEVVKLPVVATSATRLSRPIAFSAAA